MTAAREDKPQSPEKLCIFCTNCQWVKERAWGSTWTGEYGTNGFECGKGHFDAYGDGEDRKLGEIEDIRELFLRAMKCPDYDQVKV